MEIKTKRTLCLTIILGLFLVSCKSKEPRLEPLKLCSDFYKLNKDMDMSGLMNVQILGIREFSEYDKDAHKYNRMTRIIGINDSITGKNIKLPVFIDLKEKKLMFNRCDTSTIKYLEDKYGITSISDIFNFYVKEVESIYSQYYQIKIPDELPYTNIELNGCGNYIEFVLYKDEEKKSTIGATMLGILFSLTIE